MEDIKFINGSAARGYTESNVNTPIGTRVAIDAPRSMDFAYCKVTSQIVSVKELDLFVSEWFGSHPDIDRPRDRLSVMHSMGICITEEESGELVPTDRIWSGDFTNNLDSMTDF